MWWGVLLAGALLAVWLLVGVLLAGVVLWCGTVAQQCANE
jgi:hypothetical protein